ncbi:MAG: hypothetical protein HY898_31975 [Deltaproteobacteria bacterium]|nr:hypothetical protein [Deltaproteobacteria bacterium]
MLHRASRGCCVALSLFTVGIASAAEPPCAADADCKNGGVCQRGECLIPGAVPAIPPPETPSTATTEGCSKDVDCKGDRICERGTCVSPPPPPAPYVPPPAFPPPPPVAFVPPAPAPRMELKPGFLLLPRVGFILTGETDIESKASYSGMSTSSSSHSVSSDEKSLFVLDLDVLYAFTPKWRAGLGIWFTPSTRFEYGGATSKMGSDLSLVAIVEPVYPVSTSVALLVRGFAGMAMLIPGGEFQDSIDRHKSSCTGGSASADCNISEGPFPGWTLGGGGGMILSSGSVRPRIDLIFQYYSIGGYEEGRSYPTYNNNRYSSQEEDAVTGTRLMFTGGLEF